MPDRFQVDLAGMVDLLSRHLYSGPQVYIRELVQNGVDAMTARAEIEPLAPQRMRMRAKVDSEGTSTLEVSDSGIGLTWDEAHELLATIGRSSKRDVDIKRTEFIGQFGIGLLAAFMVADRVDVWSRSGKPDVTDGRTTAIHWVGYADGTFEIEEDSDSDREVGTTVTLTARAGCEHWLDHATVLQLATEYASLLPYDIAIEDPFDGEERWHTITSPDLPWRRVYDSAAARRKALDSYCEETFGWHPLGHVDFELPIVGLTGMAFILPQAVSPGSGQHRVYIKRMLLGSRVDRILPDWAFFVRAVINVDSLSPTASREQLHEDELLWEVREALGARLKQWLVDSLSDGSEQAAQFLSIHHLALRAVALTDPEILELVSKVLLYETTDGPQTLEEARENGELVYTVTLEAYRRVATVARSQGLTVVNAGYVYDAEIVAKLGKQGWKVRELTNDDVVQVLALPDADRAWQLAPALQRGQDVLAEEDCSVILRRFAPETVPAMILRDARSERRRALRIEREESPGLWGGMLDSLDSAGPERTRTLVLNDNSPIVRQLMEAADSHVFDAGLKSLYLSALMLAGEGLNPRDARSLGDCLSSLLDAALPNGHVPGKHMPGKHISQEESDS